SRRLIHALDRVLSMELPLRVTPLTRTLLRNLAQPSSGLHGHLLRHPRLLSWLGRGLLGKSPIINAMVRDTMVATVLKSGDKHNVVPADARAILSIRLLPETDPEALTEIIGRIAADCGVGLRPVMHKPANSSSLHTWTYRTIERYLRHDDPKAVVAPIL